MDEESLTIAEVDKNNFQNHLLIAVKECQKKYGRRVELATELDTLIACVCQCFENIFKHGLKRHVPKPATKKIVDVKFNEKLTFWHCVSNILSQHERDRYNNLNKVRTNIGKGRAWLRSALNERTLERYLNSLISNEELLAHYYEEQAFLRDVEKSYILPTAAAGLDPILFAISIDRDDLNRKYLAELSSNEQIIVTTPMDMVKVNDFRRKIQTKVVNFDDIPEDDGNYDDTKSSPSTTSDIFPIVELAEDAVEIINNNCSHSLSIESDDKISTGLRPIGDEAVDELIPVSVTNGESDDITLFPDYPSEDGISVDSSEEVNYQKLYELGKEELKKRISENTTLDARVQELDRENEVLKHQLRKYVSAVQMLKRDDADHSYEAQLYENKLVQVAEMHGELMELNRRLQISLLAKDETIKRLQEELVSLRGPLPSDDFSLHKLVSLWVPSVFLTGRYSDPHHVYQVHFRIGSEEWNIYRRYAQFYAFHQKLKKEYSTISGFQFPPKKTIGNKDANFVEERRKKLQLYLRQIVNFLLSQDAQLTVNPTKALFTARVQFFSEHFNAGSQSITHSIFSNCLSHNHTNSEDTTSIQYTGL